jgi:WD40 repeat protein
MTEKHKILPPPARGALFEKTAPLDPPQKLLIRLILLLVVVLLAAAGGVYAKEDPVLVIDPRGHSAMITEVMFTPDGRILISVSEDKTIRLWDVESGEVLKTLRGQVGDGKEGMLYAGALSPRGTTLAVGGFGFLGNQCHIQLFNIETGEQTGLLKGHDNVIYALAFSADGQWLASGSGDDTVRIWDVSKSGAPGEKSADNAAAVLEGHTNDVYGVAFSPGGDRVVSASFDHTLRLWQKNSRGMFSSANYIEMKKHGAEVRCVAWSPDGQYIVSGGYDDKILLWDGSGNFIKEIDELSGDISTISFSSDSKKIAAMTKHGAVYAIPSGKKISTFTRHNNTVIASAFYGSQLIATAGGDDNDIYLWDANTAGVKKHLAGQGKSVWAAAFGQGPRVAFGNKTKKGWEYNDYGDFEKSFDFSNLALDREKPRPKSFTRTRTTYLGKTLKFINDYELQVSPGIAIKNDRNTYNSIRCYTFTNDGKVVVGSSFSLKLYTGAGDFTREFTGHTGVVWAVSVSGDGRLLASASSDQTLKLWNIASGELLASLFVTVDNEWICWTPSGYYAASAGGEKYMGWHVNQGMDKAAAYYPVYSFARQYKKPPLVSRTIELFSFQDALAWYNETYKDKIETADAPMIYPPAVQWLSPVTYSLKTTADTLVIRAEIQSEKKITDFKILVNGRTAALKSEIKVLAGSVPTRQTIEFPVLLTAGENRIAIFAAHRDASAVSTERLVLYEDTESLKPNLYLVSIGISAYEKKEIRLDYADDDARAISRLFASQQGRLFKKIYSQSLYDAEATRENIIKALVRLDKNVTQKDIAVVFVAGHGYNERGRYYVLPCEGDPGSLRGTAVGWDDFADILGNLPGRILLFLDTCHSGGLDPELLEQFRSRGDSSIDNTEAIRELASEENGVVVMAASTAREISMERKEWGHGAFTKAIIEGLEERKADFSGDKIIHIRELDQYVSQRVKELTDGKQHTTTLRPTGISRFPIFQLL